MSSIYLNHAGTTWPKPACVIQASEQALRADAGDWPGTFESEHRGLADYLGIAQPRRLLLTPGCTTSLSLAVADHDWQSGDHVVCSGFEHHALHRPLQKLQTQAIRLEVIPPAVDGPLDLLHLERALSRERVRLVAVSAVSNVTGDILPLTEITALAHAHHALVLVDGAQLVGWVDLDLPSTEWDLFAFGGHKGLHAPWGIGGLYVAEDVSMSSPAATCEIPTASDASTGALPCAPMPGYCDGGSVDRVALAGLQAALDWLADRPERLTEARQRIRRIQEVLQSSPRVTLYGSLEVDRRMPTLAFNIAGLSPSEVSHQLLAHNVIVAAGLQCAPLAHQTLGTAPEGVVRISLGPQNSDRDIELTCRALRKILSN